MFRYFVSSRLSRRGYLIGLWLRTLGIRLAERSATWGMNSQRSLYQRCGQLQEWEQEERAVWECLITRAALPEEITIPQSYVTHDLSRAPHRRRHRRR
jgi:hypothetical protein